MAPEERIALTLLQLVHRKRIRFCISTETSNILARFGSDPDVQVLKEYVTVMGPTRYFKQRWARRLRAYSFTGEDAKIVALGTLGGIPKEMFLGVDQIATFDQRTINNFDNHHDELVDRLAAMCEQLAEPYVSATLPSVLPPQALLVTEQQ